MLCDYGCEREEKFKFKNGKWCCSETQNKCSEVRKKFSTSGKGRIFSEDHKRKLSLFQKGIKRKPHTEEYKKKMSLACKGVTRSEETKRKMSLHQIGEKAYWFGKQKSEKSKIKARESMKKRYLDKEFLKKLYLSINKKPNKPEEIILHLLSEMKLNFEYSGNYKVWINGKNPDFIDKNNKKIIEYFGSYHHGLDYRKIKYNDLDTNEEHAEKRIKHFENSGYCCLVIWEDEMKQIEKVKNRISKFMMG